MDETVVVKESLLAKAIIKVMQAVKNIEKNSEVGKGTNSSYKGVSDKDVKQKIGEEMAKAGLCLLALEIIPIIRHDRWEETTQYGPKMKQQVFVEVTCKYLLLHESGEHQIIVGYGHGVDSQDKAAGKATTYALKNALLYTFLVPTGTIDDTDNDHSDALPVKPVEKKKEVAPVAQNKEPVKAVPTAPSLEKKKAPVAPEKPKAAAKEKPLPLLERYLPNSTVHTDLFAQISKAIKDKQRTAYQISTKYELTPAIEKYLKSLEGE